MTSRIFRSICAVAMGVFIASIVLFMCVMYDYFTDIQYDQLKTQTQLAAQGLENEGVDYFKDLDIKNYRITWINKDGSVLFDNESNPQKMENHLKRKEVQEALKSGYGQSSRQSKTMMKRLLYSAKRLPDGTVLRLAVTQNTVLMLLIGMAQPIAIIILAALIVSTLLASRLSKKIVKPLNELNLDDPMSNEEYEELSPLLRRIFTQQKHIKHQSEELRRKQVEFETVTSEMKEGIILLDKNYKILSINTAARRLFFSNEYPVGENFLILDHSYKIQKLLKDAKSGKNAEQKIEIQDTDYQLNATPVVATDEVAGIALLAFDVTEKEKAEQMRREFTANVSHELKTPLHNILGRAELMKSSLVKSEDIPRFSEEIYKETKRMIALVEDIIKLSHLDEGSEGIQKEKIDLYNMAMEVCERLEPVAVEKNVDLDVTGDDAKIFAVPAMVSGIIYNLTDNAVKYNKKGGSVTVSVKNEKNTVDLAVADTGIGIAPQHRERIFERFYRVDKSHSRQVGGTGLGLSIVKHSAIQCGAKITIQSKLDVGTTITVKFPKE